ncbi:MAG: peptidoglycan-binding protein [Proteobacteria bacterium]|nr:peptidoglycan-binding protein [Pseudomonadota bacterium]
MPALSRRSANDAGPTAPASTGTSTGPAELGSNAERAGELASEEGGVQPTWFDEVMGLVSSTTDNVFAEEGAEQEAPKAVVVEATEEESSKGAYDTVADTATYAPKGKLKKSHDAHTKRLADGIELSLGMREQDLETFVTHYNKHKARYDSVSAQTNVPSKLIAALHWRESTGSFKKYLHQGDPIGKKSKNVPKGILFYDWETAAVDALTNQGKKGNQKNIGLTAETTDTAAIATYAEAYNGLGYMNKGRPSPYVYAGTGEYESGKYVRDGKFDKNHVDQQLGVLPMVGALGGLDTPMTAATAESEWAKVLSGTKLLRKGSSGLAVEALQEKLVAAGFETGVDGDFGSGTAKTVKEWQVSQNLTPDGVIGKNSAAKLG